MSALDKIIAGISKQANTQAAEILFEANKKAAEILKKGQAEYEELKRRLEESAHQECQEISSRAESENRRNRRLALLEVRNQVISEVISEAKTELVARNDKERFRVIEQGKILLNNSIDAIFEAERQALRDKAYAVLTGATQ